MIIQKKYFIRIKNKYSIEIYHAILSTNQINILPSVDYSGKYSKIVKIVILSILYYFADKKIKQNKGYINKI